MHALSHLAERRRIFVVPEPMIPVRVGTEWTPPTVSGATRELEYVVFDPAMRFWGAPTVAAGRSRRSSGAGFREVMRRGDTRLFRKEPGA